MTGPDTAHSETKDPGEEREPIPGECELPSGKKGAKHEFDIDIYRAWCKSCGICAAFCPKHCIQLDDEGAPVVRNADECSGCGWCELHCPDFAISVHPRQSRGKSPADED
jgi:2-oxoglutarate ferredoxin oxidoreductase subunit delta